MDGSSGSGLLWNVAPEHMPALVWPLFLPLVIWLFLTLVRRAAAGGNRLSLRFVRGYEASSDATRVAAVLLLLTAMIHLSIVPTHAQDDPQLAKLFAINGLLFIAAALAAFTWRWWRPAAALLLALTILAYISYIAQGKEDADQVGLATKMIEVLALGLIIAPTTATVRSWVRKLRWTAAGVAVMLLTLLTGVTVWAAQNREANAASAMAASASQPAHRPDAHDELLAANALSMPGMAGGGTQAGDHLAGQHIAVAAGHDHAGHDDHGGVTGMPGTGGVPNSMMHRDEPGMVMQPAPDTPPTPEQVAAANQLAANTAAGIARYRDLAAATADGYRATTNPLGPTVHYLNPKYMHDGKILDPQAPEVLVYANTRSGPLLLGAMYVMPKPGEYGPDPGGSITRWHMHDNVCFTATGFVVGVLSPFGTCPAGSFNAPTAYMMHVWTAGNPAGPFGDLDRAWLAGLIAQ
ncbi:MAG TPA: hypothetical protein VKV26_19615 [Dehalococcoidia bacterium]|nr:hypothetical protein [Dehalococcoidia bacterium]